MSLPQWADADASSGLLAWIEAGESSTQEFKEVVPEQARKLAQEIAALATSGGGRVLLGVSDSGELIGITAGSGAERDAYVERVQGIVDSIRPDVEMDLVFAVAGEVVVLVVLVPEQTDPVFYVDHRPYIRDKRRSRPARPKEVVACVWAHPSAEHQKAKERLHEQRLADIMSQGKSLR